MSYQRDLLPSGHVYIKFSLARRSAVVCGCLLGIAAGAQSLGAQQLERLHHTVWSTQDGLPVSGVVRMQRSPDGYLWLGSAAGLMRFDGVRFTLMDSIRAPDLHSPHPGPVQPLVVDRDGVLWISRADGALVRYSDGLFRIAVTPDSAIGPITDMTRDAQDRLWVIGRGGTLHILRDDRIVRPPLPAAVPTSGVLGVIPDTGNGVWIGTATGELWHVTDAGGTLVRLPEELTPTQVRPLLHAHDGTLWVIASGVRSFDGERWTLLPSTVGPGVVHGTSVIEAADGSVWIGTRGTGLLRWADGHLEQFSERHGLTDGVVHGLLADAEGSVWITTDGGLDRFRAATFTTLGAAQGLTLDSPRSILTDHDGSLWVYGDASKLLRLDGGIVRNVSGPVAITDASPPAGDTYYPIAAGRPDGVWIVDWQQRLLRYRGGTATPIRAAGMPQRRAVRALHDSSGALWVSLAPTGFGRVRDGRYEEVRLPGGGASPYITAMVEDQHGHVWVATRDSAALFQFAGDVAVRRIDAASGLREPLTHLATEGPDTIWGSTQSGALVRILSGRATTLQLPDGRFANPSLAVAGGHLWFASGSGLGRLPIRALHAAMDGGGPIPETEIFGAADGIPVAKSPSMTLYPVVRAADGRVWFATPAGLAVADPGAPGPGRAPPRVLVEDMTVAGVRAALEPEMEIGPNPDRVEIAYTATSLLIPERVRIEYQLEGADREWVAGGVPRVARYTQLRPGRYTFRVRAWNEAGIPSTDEALLVFRVRPAWYQAGWFIGLILLLTASAGASIVYGLQRARALRSEERVQARLDATLAERTRVARELHDTLLQGFTGITLQLQAVHRTLETDPRAASVALSRVLSLGDSTLREARQMVWEMRAPELDQYDLADALEKAARIAMADSAIELHFSATGLRRRLPLTTETALLRIGREAVMNSVKHAHATTIDIHLDYEPNSAMLSVRDNGRGFDINDAGAAGHNGHWGISGMRERASRAGGTITITSGSSRGTRVVARVPVDDN